MQPLTRLPHLVRGSSAAAIATFAALLSHVAGGGAMPGFLGVTVPLLLSLMLCILLAGRKLSLIRLSVSVVASQALFHTLFVLGTPSQRAAQPHMPAGHHQGHGMMPAPTLPEHTMALVHGDLMMWVSHLIGAAVTVFFLYRSEQATHLLRSLAERFLAWMGHRLTAPPQIPVLAGAAVRLPATETSGWTVLSQLRTSTLIRRGPPHAIPIAR